IFDLALVLLLAVLMGFVSRRIGLPAIIGYLFAGLIVSPFTPGYVASSEQLSLLADIGVAILLFEVGIEIEFRKISKQQKQITWAAPIQVLIGLSGAFIIYQFTDISFAGSMLIAIAVALSSSVVIVNITRSKKRTTNKETEDSLLIWSVIQDVFGLLIAGIVIAIYTDTSNNPAVSIANLAIYIVIALFYGKAIHFVLDYVKKEKDLFLIFSFGSGLALAGLGSIAFNIPIALAAFVAGVAINRTEDTEELRRLLLPFRDIFAVLFFVVIGTLIIPNQFVDALPFLFILLVLLFGFKTLPIYLMAKLSKIKARPLQLSIGLSQMGEFSFVLGSIVYAKGEIDRAEFSALLIMLMISIAFATVFVRLKRFSKQKS
ncbi:MAG: cation:proton antiporter, partial [Actinomycetes bacterium]